MGERDNPYPYIAKADLLVSTSYSEAYPTVINEAQVLSVPVVANDYPSAYEIVDCNCGFICNLKEMPKLLSEIVNDKNGVYSSAKSESRSFVYNNAEILDSINKLFEIY